MTEMRKSPMETLTLRADRIAAFPLSEGQKSKSDIYKRLTACGSAALPEKIPYYLDLDAAMVYRTVVKSRTERPGNGYFDQLLRVKRDFAGRNPAYLSVFEPTDLVYMDFAEVIRQKKEDFAKDLFAHGFVMKAGARTAWMLPFDKSASMSRKSVITFVDETLMAELEQRLTLGIFRKDQNYALSKVYAYRGLYLSSGTRIEEVPGEFELNERSVVVIPDTMSHRRNRDVRVFTETLGYDKETEQKPEYGEKTYGKKSEEFEVNCFDGEGLICPEYAGKLGVYLKELGQPESMHATSFQIRLPFGKGMLHQADFVSFCEEEFGMDPERDQILDCFGFPRRLADIKIVLTASMFKAHAWVKECFGAGGADPMAEYFRRFHAYGHALYLLRTDRSLFNAGFVSLNYQFLNTGTMKAEAFGELVENSLRDYTLRLSQDPEMQLSFFLGVKEEADQEEEETESSGDKMKRLLAENEALLRETYVKNQISGAVHAQYMDAMRGNLMVRGENRFLSGDLLFLLREFAHRRVFWDKNGIRILGMNPGKEKTPKAKAFYRDLERQQMKDKFYAPANPRTGIVWERGRMYAILRNPHLSRNEQFALAPYVPKSGRNLYKKYLGHLSGVLMLPYGSPDAERLSGADFDGDMVKCFDHEALSASAAESCRENPLVQIPHGSEKKKEIPAVIKFDDIKDGFDSKVGQLSNLAIQIGEEEYNENRQAGSGEKSLRLGQLLDMDAGEVKDYAAISCILVGQEIDKAKTGTPPYTEEVTQVAKGLEGKFLHRQDELSGKRIFGFRRQEDGSFLFADARRKRAGELRIEAPGAEDPNLERLMYLVLEAREKLEAEKKERPKSGKEETRLSYRKPEQKTSWNLRGYLALAMTAYAQTIRTAVQKNRLRKDYRETPYSAFIYNILYKQHDSERELFGPKKDQSIPEMAEAARTLMGNLCKADPKAPGEILEKSIRDGWIYLPKEERGKKLEEYFALERFGETEYAEYGEDLALAKEMLTDFSVRGYLLLSYVCKDAVARQEVEQDFADRDLLDEGRDDTITRRLALAARQLLKEKEGITVPACGAELLFQKYRAGQALAGPKERTEKLIEGRIPLTTELLQDEILQLKYPLREEDAESLKDVSAGEFLALIRAAEEIYEMYEPIRQKYYDAYLEVDHFKDDVDEEGNFAEKSLKKALAKKVWKDIAEHFAKGRRGQEAAALCWSELRSRYDSAHTFLWEVIPEHWVREILGDGFQPRKESEEGEEEDVR